MRSSDIRSSFREFFSNNGHQVLPSASLVPPAYDPSVLLTTAGMQPFRPFFLGLKAPPAPRVTSTQKCFRTTDIDEVGKTARHLTFFEMMGNFSFGDYFKADAIPFAWELSTEGWGFDPERIWVTVFRGDEHVPADEEAVGLWREIGFPAERIVRLGDDNFWKAGPTGPCGPCSELYYDRGPEHGCGRPTGTGPGQCAPGCDCDRFLEFWNLVFMQYDREADGTLTPLPRPSIDTGAGVERVAALLQGVHSVYETDGFQAIIGACESWSGASYESVGVEQKALRILADHGRGMAMLATDGVLPGNEGRSYILRRVIRRAIAHGHRIGIASPFLPRLHAVVLGELGEAYPDLIASADEVAAVLLAEEEQFARTLATGSVMLEEAIARTRAGGARTFAAEEAFRLHDTYGFPVEVTAEIVAEQDLSMDDQGFARLMGEQRERSRAARSGGLDRNAVAAFASESGGRSIFVGYDELVVHTMASAVSELGSHLLVKLDRSPFYAESGGQVSDRGRIEWDGGWAHVVDAIRFDGDQVLIVEAGDGTLVTDTPVVARVDVERRRPTLSNHTGTHLLHQALRDVLGPHVEQRGSAVRPDKLRFDFNHPRPMTPEEVEEVEDRVNDVVMQALPVRIFETSQDEARKLGAMMLFGEKYGDVVRVVDIVGYSTELCGGTHCASSAEVGPLKIISEGSSSQGIRRVEAVTGATALGLLRERERAASAAARELRVEPTALVDAVHRLRTQIRELQKSGGSTGGVDLDSLIAEARPVNGIAVLVASIPDATGDALLEFADRLRGKLGGSIVVLGSVADGKVSLVAAATADAVSAGFSAADAIKAAAPLVGGGGGGRPNLARAGGKDPGRLPEALEAARTMLTGA